MSFFNRISHMISGFYGGVEAPAGLVYDLGYDIGLGLKGESPDGGFVHDMLDHTIKRGTQTIDGLMGPHGGLGEAIGAVPKVFRQPADEIIHPILNSDRWLYTNGFSHPLATLLKVGSLTESEAWLKSQGESDWGAFLDPHTWGAAWHMTKHMSPGQALAENVNFAFVPMVTADKLGGRDVTDKAEANKFAGTDFMHVTSGLTDAFLSWNYDPLQIAGEVAGGYRMAYHVRPLLPGIDAAGKAAYKEALAGGATTEEAIAEASKAGVAKRVQTVGQYVKTDRWQKLSDRIGQINEQYPNIDRRVAAIKDTVFPNVANNEDLAYLFARATTPEAREMAVRIGMGDSTAIQLLHDSSPALAEDLRLNFEHTAMVKDPTYLPEYHQDPAYRPDADPKALFTDVDNSLDMHRRMTAVEGSIVREMGAPGRIDELRVAAKQSEFYQHSAITKPWRVFTNNVSSNLVDLADTNHIEQIERSLREAGMDYDQRQAWVGRIANEPIESRMDTIKEAESAAIRMIADRHGLAPADLDTVLEGGEQYRGASRKIIENAPKDKEGNIQLHMNVDDEMVRLTHKAIEPENLHPLTPMKQLDRALSNLEERYSLDGITRAPREELHKLMKVWRAGVLLRPAWPLRVIGEHGAAMIGKLEDLSFGMPELRKEIQKYASWRDGTRRAFRTYSNDLGFQWGGGTGAIFGGIVAGPFGAIAGGAAGAGLQRWGRSLEEIPYHQIAINGILAHGAFGSALDKDNVYHDLVSNRQDLDAAIGRTKRDRRLLHPTPPEEKVTVLPGHSLYPSRYEEAIAHLQEDPLARVILAHDHGMPVYRPAGIDIRDLTGDEAGMMWLENTPEGRAHAKAVPIRAKNPEEWTGTMRQLVHDMTAGSPELAKKFLGKGGLSSDDVQAWVDRHFSEYEDPAFNEAEGIPWADYPGHGEGNVHTALPFSEDFAIRHVDRRTYDEGRVPLNRLITDQPYVEADRIKSFAKNEPGADHPIKVAKVGDQYFLLDGNHRVHAALARGEKHLNARIYEFDHAAPGETLSGGEELMRSIQTERRMRAITDQHRLPGPAMPDRTIKFDDLRAAVEKQREFDIPEGFSAHPHEVEDVHEGWDAFGGYQIFNRMLEADGFYHTTTDLPGVMEKGLLARDQLPPGRVGLGTHIDDPLDYNRTHVSVSPNEEFAQRLAGMLQLASNAAKGNLTHAEALAEFSRIHGGILDGEFSTKLYKSMINEDVEPRTIWGHVSERTREILIGKDGESKFPRYRVNGKFASVKNAEDLSRYYEQLGLTPFESVQATDDLLGYHETETSSVWFNRKNVDRGEGASPRFVSEGPTYMYSGLLADQADYARMDPGRIGVVKVAVKKDARSATLGIEDNFPEVAFRPEDVAVIRSGGTGYTDPVHMPALHPEYQAQTMGTSRMHKGFQNVVDNLFNALGTIPIDELINNRYYAQVYRSQMAARLTGIAPHLVTDDVLHGIEQSARAQSLESLRHLMYDFANRSEFANSMRLIMPFFPAWQQTIQRWAGIALENPAFIQHASQVLGAPGKMGITWKDKDTGEEYVRLRIPSVGKALLNHGFLKGALDDQSYFKFQTKGLSMAGEGLPGFGPFVDVGLRPFVKDHPDLIKSLKMIYPFGTLPNSAIESFLPPTMQRLVAVNDEDARSHRAAYNRILVTRMVKMSTGEIPKMNLNDPGERAEFLGDVANEARQFSAMRLVIGAMAPAALQYDSPYQPLIDKYQELLKTDPLHAQDRFLDTYGDDFFALTQSFTKLNNGIPATIEGDKEYQKYMDLVQKYPELGGLITGQDGAGSAAAFSAAIYQKQRNTPVRPGSDLMQRSAMSGEEVVQSEDTRLGWIKFTRAMDLVDAEMAHRGLMNLNQTGAADLRAVKDLLTSSIAQAHPQWYADYSQRNDVDWDNKIAAMHVISDDPRLSQRPDIQILKKYLNLRTLVMDELAQRQSSTLNSASNADLAVMWDSAVQSMKRGPGALAFSQLYNRYLIHDPLTTTGVNTIGVTNA